MYILNIFTFSFLRNYICCLNGAYQPCRFHDSVEKIMDAAVSEVRNAASLQKCGISTSKLLLDSTRKQCDFKTAAWIVTAASTSGATKNGYSVLLIYILLIYVRW